MSDDAPSDTSPDNVVALVRPEDHLRDDDFTLEDTLHEAVKLLREEDVKDAPYKSLAIVMCKPDGGLRVLQHCLGAGIPGGATATLLHLLGALEVAKELVRRSYDE